MSSVGEYIHGGLMTGRLDFATVRMANDHAVRADDVRRRSSGFHYWLIVPFAAVAIWWSAMRLVLAGVRPS